MFRILFVVAAVIAVASAGWFDAGTVANQFIVTYSIVPDPMHTFSFYKMPRTLGAAKQDKFTQAFHQSGSDDVGLLEGHVTLWCRDEDYRVCVYFDKKGSVAGIKLSATVSEIEAANVPLDIAAIPEWRKQMFLAQPVYSASAFFQSQDELLSGGRTMTDDTLTAPNGLYILQTDSSGFETGFLHVPNAEAEATSAGFTEQACFYGMGKHYFQNLAKSGTCEAHRPYFLLFGPKTKQLQGFGFVQYGKVSQGRGWFETPPALVAKKIAPNSPDCMTKWINKYGLFTMHVFFVEKPYYTRC